MKILVFCDKLNPPGYIPRVRYFCNYLAEKEHNITIITEPIEKENLFSEKIELITHNYFFFQKPFLKKVEWLYKTAINLIFDHKGQFFYKKTAKTLSNRTFDVVFCSSTFHSFPLTTAGMVAKKKDIPLLSDLRDIIEQTPQDSKNIFIHKLPSFLENYIINRYKKIHINRRDKILSYAKAITSVSQWHNNFLSKINRKTKCLYNGFDERIFVEQKRENNSFVISYFGEITDINLRCPLLFFEAIKKLKQNYLLDKSLKIKWFIDRDSKKTVEGLSKKYDVEDLMFYENFVFGENLATEMSRSSILLIFGNNTKIAGYNGIMTTKFFEYIGVNRPILHTPCNSDELSYRIQAINGGLSTSNILDIENFILEKQSEWQKYKRTKGNISPENRQMFSLRNSAVDMEKLLVDVVKF